jgi:hypothetical protein
VCISLYQSISICISLYQSLSVVSVFISDLGRPYQRALKNKTFRSVWQVEELDFFHQMTSCLVS